MHGLLHDIGIAVIAATTLGLIALFLRQPIILGYLIAGALVGPLIGFGLVEEANSIEVISEIGLILLLFVIGLEMQAGKLLAAGRQLLVAGFGQFLACAAMGVALFYVCGYGFGGAGQLDGLYLALVCGLSSTAIVVKLLYDKIELDTIAGRLTLGILIIQDVYAILVLAFQPNFADPQLWPIVKAIGASAVLLIAGFAISSLALKRVFAAIAKSPELVVATSIGWCALVAGVAGAMDLSREMGALVAGLSISAFPYSVHVTAKTLPLRDFFLTLFFLSLGMKITMPRPDLLGPVALVVTFVIASRFLTVYPLLALSGAGRRTCFLTSLNLAQLSEFSLVIAALGVSLGHIGGDTMSVLIYAMAITAVLSSYAIRGSQGLFRFTNYWMSRVGWRSADDKRDAESAVNHSVVILGYHHVGRALLAHITEHHAELTSQVLVVDYNPETLASLRKRRIATAFGDLSSADSLEHVHLGHATIIVSTIPDMLLKGTTNRALVKMCRALAPNAQIIALAETVEQEAQLQAVGASIVLSPHTVVGAAFSQIIVQHVAAH